MNQHDDLNTLRDAIARCFYVDIFKLPERGRIPVSYYKTFSYIASIRYNYDAKVIAKYLKKTDKSIYHYIDYVKMNLSTDEIVQEIFKKVSAHLNDIEPPTTESFKNLSIYE